jgi:hypothetical protein
MDPCFFWSFWSAAVYLVGVSFPGRLSPPFDSSLPGGLVPCVLAHDPVGYFLSFSHLVLPPRFAYLFFILFSKPTPALFSFGFICRSSRYWDWRVGWLRLFSSVCCSVPSLVSLLFSILLFSGAAAYVCMRGRAISLCVSMLAFGTIWKKHSFQDPP